jgi:hypothetical protein
VSKAYFVDTHESPVAEGGVTIEDSLIDFEVTAHAVASICVEFEHGGLKIPLRMPQMALIDK